MKNLIKVVNVYFNEKKDSDYLSGLVLELEDGRFMQHGQDGYVVPFSEVKEEQ